MTLLRYRCTRHDAECARHPRAGHGQKTYGTEDGKVSKNEVNIMRT